MARGGQFIYNRTEKKWTNLERSFQDIVGVIHGQMKGDDVREYSTNLLRGNMMC